MNRVERLNQLEKLMKTKNNDRFIVTVDGETRRTTLDECFKIVQSEDFLNEHDVTISSDSNSDGILGALLNDLCS